MKTGIERLTLRANDDGTYTLEVTPSRMPRKDNADEDGKSVAVDWPETKTLTASNLDEALEKVQELMMVPVPGKNAKRHPLEQYLSNDTGEESDSEEQDD